MAKGGRYSDPKKVEVREMQNAETILGIIRERGERGLPLERVYRQLFNQELYPVAYGKIYRNQGAMTPGISDETVDGMSLGKIRRIIEDLKFERYQWSPTRRVNIEKKNSDNRRPLGIPTWSDKLLQEVIRLLFEAYYEPQFSGRSHGFRPGRGCHTALQEIRHTWTGTAWFIQGDISNCFDKLDHEILLSILREKIHDNRFIRLIENLLKAGYLENWRYNETFSGTPQGGIVSPFLANAYLDRLDRFVEDELLPNHNRGPKRKNSAEYERYRYHIKVARDKGDSQKVKELERVARSLPSQDTSDPRNRRLRYIRYADDFLLGFNGPEREAEEIKQRLGEFLQTIKLDLSETKMVITHARTDRARFLGYEVGTIQDDQKRHAKDHRRVINGRIQLGVPKTVIREKCVRYMEHGKPIHLPERINNSEYTIIDQYQAEYRGIVEYYRLAYNRRMFTELKWVMEQSLTKTLAAKLKITVSQVYDRFGTTLQTSQGPRKGLRVVVERDGKKPLVSQWGGISLQWEKEAVLDDRLPKVWNVRSELVQRLLADECELCGSQDDVEVHHIRALKDLRKPGRPEKPLWAITMAARKRKTLAVCRECHLEIHR